MASSALFTSPNPTPLKAGLQEWGIIPDTVRPPMVTLTQEEKAKLFKVLSTYQKLSV
jgi:dihydrodipicolinate synthase/N-acetylneuraminate lyase